VAKKRGRYSSPAQIERRQRILRQTVLLLEAEGLASFSMSRIAEMSSVSTKTLYNLFSNRAALLLAAAANLLDEVESSDVLLNSEPGVPRILGFTESVMSLFQRSPDFMESVISVIMQISPEEEAEHHRMSRVQKSSYEALLVANEQGELLPDTDCLQLSQLLAESQWGATLLWQKHLISLEQLAQHTLLMHCIVLMPFCTEERRSWLESKMRTLMGEGSVESVPEQLLKVVNA